VIDEQRPTGTVIGPIRNASKRVAISQIEVRVNAVKPASASRDPGQLTPPKSFIDGGGIRPSAGAGKWFRNSFDRMAIQR